MLTKCWLISPAAIRAHGGREQSILTSQGTFRSVNSRNILFCRLKEHFVLSTQRIFRSLDSTIILFCRLKEHASVPICLSASVPICLSASVLICLPLCQSVCLPLCQSVYFYANLSASVPICLPQCQSVVICTQLIFVQIDPLAISTLKKL